MSLGAESQGAHADSSAAEQRAAAEEYAALLAGLRPRAAGSGIESGCEPATSNDAAPTVAAACTRPPLGQVDHRGTALWQRCASAAGLPATVQRRALVQVYCEESDVKVSEERLPRCHMQYVLHAFRDFDSARQLQAHSPLAPSCCPALLRLLLCKNSKIINASAQCCSVVAQSDAAL